jgi:hypothetical protein
MQRLGNQGIDMKVLELFYEEIQTSELEGLNWEDKEDFKSIMSKNSQTDMEKEN